MMGAPLRLLRYRVPPGMSRDPPPRVPPLIMLLRVPLRDPDRDPIKRSW